jgi:hypothetical protein
VLAGVFVAIASDRRRLRRARELTP